MTDNNAFLQLLAAAQASQRTTPTRNGHTGSGGGGGGAQQTQANLMLWQSLFAAQAQAQIIAFQQMQQQQQQQQQQQGLGEIFRQLTEMTNKNNVEKKTIHSQPSTSGATATIKEGGEIHLEAGEIPKIGKSTSSAQSALLDPAMWQMLAARMLQQQSALSKATNGLKKESNGVLDLSSVNRTPKSEPGTSSDGADTRSTTTPCETMEHGKKRPPATEAQVRVPLKLGWRRQTCIRAIAASGVRGDVVYYAPCGKKLSSYAEVIRYLMKNPCPSITRDNFSFSSKMIVGEFIYPKEAVDGEKLIAKLTEEEVAEQVNLLVSQKPPPKNGERKVKEPIQRAPTPEEIHDLYDLTENPKGHDDEEKTKWSREPVDDLTLTEIRPMPELTRMESLSLTGEGFADALMVFEFCQNFADVLSISRETLPSLDDFVRGLEGDRNHQDKVLLLTKTLFGLSLEYPGLPSGKRGHTALGQSLADVGMCRENYSELMRQFLDSRCSQGKDLALLLENKHFEELGGEQKASILAFFCNELVCCRNIVKEIDNNLEEIGKLKGERWLRDGKARALRGHQKRKKKEEKIHHEEEGEAENSDSDGSRPGSPQPLNNKKLTPGLGQVEILTHEEENMSVEELDEVISQLKMESDELKDQINGLNNRVRSFPFGWDRYHRQYWQLPHIPTVLVESIESSGQHNPACNATEVCSKDPKPYETPSFTDPDVVAVVEDLIDEVIMSRIAPEKRKRKKCRRLENGCKRGWWIVESREQLEAVRGSLHGRGIRERCLHRLLCKSWFLKDVRLQKFGFSHVEEAMTSDEVAQSTLDNVRDAISALEHRICDAQLGPQGWTPAPATFPAEEPEQWDFASTEGPSQTLDELKQRLLDCEGLVERRYLRQNFYSAAVPSAADVLGIPMKEEDASEETIKEEGSSEDSKEENKEEEEDMEKEAEEDNRELSDRWKNYIQEAKTPAQLMLAVQCLESSIAWERSITETRCQICQTSENAEDLLLCDGCEMGYHMQCFKPAMPGIPEGKWYCPRCRESAGGKPICVLCQKEGAPIYPCRKCYNFLHIECSGQHTPDGPSDYFCPACEPKNFERRVIMRGESEERGDMEEMVDSEVKDFRRGAKRKADPLAAITFPTHMNVDLCRTMLDELEQQPSVGPFMEPVDTKLVPGYKEIIKNPIDISTIRNKVECMCYETPDDFAADLDLMFNNCRTFNEDDSPVGIAGQTLQKFFMKRWRQVKYNYSKRLRRLKPHSN